MHSISLFLLLLSLVAAIWGEGSTIVDLNIHKQVLSTKVDVDARTPEYECVDDTECDRGYRCAENHCVEIPQCKPWQGRENGDRHGACLECRSDTDCGWWSKGEEKHCWPDGACRSVPPFYIMTFIKDYQNATRVVEPASTFIRGQTMCASVIPSAGDQRDHLDVRIRKLQMCALKQTAAFSDYRRGLRAAERKDAEEGRQEGAVFPYDGIQPYDALFHETTGCRSDPNTIRVYTVYDQDEKIADFHHFEAFAESGLPGTSTVCFDALPISPSTVPVYMEFTVSVKPSDAEIQEHEQQDVVGQLKAFGVAGKNGKDENGKKHQSWRGLVATSQDIELFIGCPGGKEFDGVAGICERPSVAHELFFWVLLLSFVVLIAGSVFFVFEYKRVHAD
jgi:hypothetical protein